MKETHQFSQDAFGKYLLEKGVISQEDLARAQSYLHQRNQRFGELAVEQGLLTPAQVLQLVDRQKQSSKFFGELAVEQGLLSRRELDDLLFSQTVHSFSLGEALLEEGLVTSQEFADAMQEFSWLEREKQRVVWEALESMPESEIMPAVAQSLGLAFMRFTGQQVKVECLCSSTRGGSFGPCWTICLLLRGCDWMECCLIVSPPLLETLRETMLQASSPVTRDAEPSAGPDAGKEALDGSRSFMEIVARYLSQALGARDIAVTTWTVTYCEEKNIKPMGAICLSLLSDACKASVPGESNARESDLCLSNFRGEQEARLKVFVSLSCPQCPCP